ncbi:MAG: PilN domain-containing protein [Omnitrophica bacterium]|nr:PilN domain-containing protein [Candidatus Omnitrophota bacterium]
MVQINLLPVSAKKKRKVKVELKVKLGPVIFILAALFAVIIMTWVSLGVSLVAKQKQVASLDEQLESSKSDLERLVNLREDKEKLTRKLEFMEKQLKREVLWAKNLNRLSNLIPSGIWLKNITLHSERQERSHKYTKLNINGSAVSLRGEEMIDLIGKFMSALKKDEVFFEQFSKIELISSQRRKGKGGKVDVMDFKLLCRFR